MVLRAAESDEDGVRPAQSRAAALFPSNLHTEPPCVSKRVFRRPCNARLPAPNRVCKRVRMVLRAAESDEDGVRPAQSRAAALFPSNLDTEPPCVSKRVFRRPCNARLPAPNRVCKGVRMVLRAAESDEDGVRPAQSRAAALVPSNLHTEPPCVSKRVFRRPCNARLPAPNRVCKRVRMVLRAAESDEDGVRPAQSR